MENHEVREAVTLESQGQKLFGIFHRPVNAKGPVPTVLFCHGFASNKIGKYRFYVSMAEALTKQGVAAFRFDYRGSGDSEGRFEEMTLEGEVQDTLTALAFLKTNSWVDAQKIGILGRSLGGAVSVLAAAKEPSVKSLALWAPVFHAGEWREQMNTARGLPKAEIQAMEHLYGDLPNPQFLSQFFTMDLRPSFKKIEAIPLLHIHGEQDTIVPITHADEYRKVRDGIAAETQFIALPKSDHSFSNKNERMQALEITKNWFLNTLNQGFQ